MRSLGRRKKQNRLVSQDPKERRSHRGDGFALTKSVLRSLRWSVVCV